MARIYIANGQLGTVLIVDELPPHLILGQFKEFGPSVDNRQPPRSLATDRPSDLRDHPFFYTSIDITFLEMAPLGCWQKSWSESGPIWEIEEG